MSHNHAHSPRIVMVCISLCGSVCGPLYWYILKLVIVCGHSCLYLWLPAFELPGELKLDQSVICFLSVWCQQVTVTSLQGPVRSCTQDPIVWNTKPIVFPTHTLPSLFKCLVMSNHLAECDDDDKKWKLMTRQTQTPFGFISWWLKWLTWAPTRVAHVSTCMTNQS